MAFLGLDEQQTFDAIKDTLTVLLGALIALAGSYFAQISQNRKTEERERRAVFDREKLGAIRATIALMRLVDRILGYKKDLDDALSRANEIETDDIQPFVLVPESVGADAPLDRVLIDDLLFLAKAKENNILSTILHMEKRHDVIRASFPVYNQLRASIFSRLKNTTFDGPVGSAKISKAEYRDLEPDIVKVNTLLAQIVEMVDEDAEEIVKTSRSFGLFCRSYFSDNEFPIAAGPV